MLKISIVCQLLTTNKKKYSEVNTKRRHSLSVLFLILSTLFYHLVYIFMIIKLFLKNKTVKVISLVNITSQWQLFVKIDHSKV